MSGKAAAEPRPGAAPALPPVRGPLSADIAAALAGPADAAAYRRLRAAARAAADADPFGDDLQLALYLCYEQHYGGFDAVDAAWEWEPALLAARQAAERVFTAALRAAVDGGDDVEAALAPLLVEPLDAAGPSHVLKDSAAWWQMREYLVHRSPYQLKEADPYAWAVPRFSGQAKASLVAVQFDEFGAGRGERVHARLFAEAMTAAGLDAALGHYLDHVPAESLAAANLVSLLGLHRSFRGALAGHFAVTEITSSPASQRIASGLRRLGAADACVRFFTEHVEADAVHEQVMRHLVIDDLVAREPGLAADIVFGIQAVAAVEHRLADRMLTAWREGVTSLRRPLPG